MAESGSFNASGGYESRTIQFRWSQSARSITENTTTIYWELIGVGGSSLNWYGAGNFKVVIDGTTVYSSATRINLYAGTTVACGQYTFTHNADGTRSFTVYIEAGIYYYAVNATGNATFTLEPIPRASVPTLSAYSTPMGSSVTIYTNRASNSFTHTIKYSFGNAAGTIATGIANYTTWTIPLNLANQIPNSTSGTGTIICETYNGGSLIGTKTVAFVATVPASVKPSCDFTFSDTTSCYATYGKFVQNKSSLNISVSTTLAYGSSIKSYIIQVDGKTYTSKNVTTDVLTSSGNRAISVYVTDNRGRTSDVVTKNISILPYQAPIVNLMAFRCNAAGKADKEGAYMRLSITGEISSLDGRNTATYELKYKKATDSTWNTITGAGTSYTSPVLSCDISSVWDVEGRIIDALTPDPSPTSVTIPIAFILIDFHSSGRGVTFGGVATDEGFNILNMPIRFNSELLTDHVVEQGVTGIWKYRKWRSGVAECWGNITITNKNVSNSTGSLYYAVGNTIIKPWLFIDKPVINTTFTADGADVVWTTARYNPSTSDYIEILILRTLTGTVSGRIGVYLIGRWK